MTAAFPPAFSVAAGAWWRAVLALAWVVGVALQLQQPRLWPWASYPLIAAGALCMALMAGRVRTLGSSRALAVAAAAALGFACAGWRADARSSDALAPEWEGCDIELVGTIAEMPQVAEDGEHFAFAVESARALTMTARDLKRVASLDAAAGRPLTAAVVSAVAPVTVPVDAARRRRSRDAPPAGVADAASGADRLRDRRDAAGPTIAVAEGSDMDIDADRDDAIASDAPRPAPTGGAAPRVPSLVWLSWNRNPRDDRAVAGDPAPLRAGQRWRVPVRLRLPHGAMNPDGFDAELWLFDQGLRATGVVRGNGTLLSQGIAPIENLRQWVRDRLLVSGAGGLGDPQAAGALAALAVGDQAAIDGPGWEVFRNTGVAHLMSISGVYVTLKRNNTYRDRLDNAYGIMSV
jgi:predicted membrane metal-binding protein